MRKIGGVEGEMGRKDRMTGGDQRARVGHMRVKKRESNEEETVWCQEPANEAARRASSQNMRARKGGNNL